MRCAAAGVTTGRASGHVRDACVIGIPGEVPGERICARVVIPHPARCVDALPLTGPGTTTRRALGRHGAPEATSP